MADKYLSLSGVNYLWGKIKDEISASAGGGDALIVAFKLGGTNNNTRTCSHTFADIKAAYDAKKPVYGINRLTTNNVNSCVLYISSASSSSITFEGLYQYNTNSVRRLYITLSSANVVNYYDNTTVVSKITSTNQLSNGGPSGSEWWEHYATNRDTYDALNNPLIASDPENGSPYDPILTIYQDTPTSKWLVSAVYGWYDLYGNQQNVATFSDLYYYLSQSGPSGVPAKLLPVLYHDYNPTDTHTPVELEFPNTYSSFDYKYAGFNHLYWLTLTSVKYITYGVNGDDFSPITFVFTTTDVRLEDKATILRTFILQGNATDTIDGSEIEIRDTVLQSVVAPLYNIQTNYGGGGEDDEP